MTYCLKWAGSEDFYNDDLISWGEALESVLITFRNHVSAFNSFRARYDGLSIIERELFNAADLFNINELKGIDELLINSSSTDLLLCPKQILNNELGSYLAEVSIPVNEVRDLDLRPVAESLGFYTAFNNFKLPIDLLLSFKPVNEEVTRAFSLISRLYSVSDVKNTVCTDKSTILGYIGLNITDLQLASKKILSLLLVKAFYGNYDTFRYHLLAEGLEVVKEEPLLYI